MAHEVIEIADDFWNIRGVFRLFGMLDIGTHCSLVRLASGRYLLLDGVTLEGAVKDKVLAKTDGGRAIEAVAHLHPFHTLHVKPVAEMLPHATLYGTARHHRKFPDLPWAPDLTESPEFAAKYADDLDFTVPRGVLFIPKNENLHFASVMATHQASGTLHVDDTLNWTPMPFGGRLGFHPTLKPVLLREPGATASFRAWAEELVASTADVTTVCTAHASKATLQGEAPGVIADNIEAALGRVEKTLRQHASKFGA